MGSEMCIRDRLTGLDFDFKTVSGSLDMHDFKSQNLTIVAKDLIYRATPEDVSGASDIASSQIEIVLDGTFTLSGSEADVANGIYTTQAGTMTLASSISLTDTDGNEYSATDFLPTNTLALDFDGTLDFNENDLTITDTSDVLVTYDSDNNLSLIHI